MYSKNKGQEIGKLRANAIKFLMENPINNFISMTEIEKKFGLYEGYCRRHLLDFFPIGEKEEYYDKKTEIIYYTQRGFSELFLIDENTAIQKLKNVPFIKIYHKSERIVAKKFYDISKIIDLLPKEYKKIYKALNAKIDIKNIAKTKPRELKLYQYYVLCIIMIFKTKNDFWPSLRQIRYSMKKIFDSDYSISAIHNSLDKLSKLGYLKRYKFSEKISWVYKIFEGPICLTHKKVLCINPITDKQVYMLAPRDFFHGSI